MDDWDIAPGKTLLRSELHDRWGGGRRGGMEPAVKAESVFLFTKPSVGELYGYNYDGWQDDGMFHYTGDGQEGDQMPNKGGNSALLKAPEQGRTIRLFRSEGKVTTYVGRFNLAEPAWFRADAPDRNTEMRSVLVFRLVPDGEVITDEVLKPSAGTAGDPEEIPLEALDIESYVLTHPDEPPIALRREAQLVRRYATWLAASGTECVRHRIPVPGSAHLYTDAFDKSRSELIEAKGSSARNYVRLALGQLLDYARYLNHEALAVLLPSKPPDDLIKLLADQQVAVIWEEGPTFRRSA